MWPRERALGVSITGGAEPVSLVGGREPITDQLGRPLRDLRLSLTDRCNLRCKYCMPEADYAWLPRGDVLTTGELGRLVDAFVLVGVEKVRLTGGEPLLRRDVPDVVAQIAGNPSIRDLAMTTNGVLLAQQARALASAGLQRVTVSLDTLRPDRFQALTGRASLADVLAGIDSLAEAGLGGTRINAVVTRGFNDDEILDLLEFGARTAAEVRFIEYMDVGGATRWNAGAVVSAEEILGQIERHHGSVERLGRRDAATASRFALPDGQVFAIVSSTTNPFCASCDRSRVTSDGMWFRCLYAEDGTDLRTPLRDGASARDLAQLLAQGWTARTDQGAVERLALASRGTAVSVGRLKQDPHLEMHTRGG